jgi:dienelactone hydrolase
MISDTLRQTLPFGEWPSPITAEQVAASSGGSSWPSPVGAETWWCASDPQTATVRLLRTGRGAAEPVAVLPAHRSVRNRSLGYGGRPYLVVPGAPSHLLVFTDHRDQRLYRAEVAALGERAATPVPVPLTPADAPGVETCYAGMVLGPGGDEVWCVRETTRAATGPEDADPAGRTRREIVAIPLDGRADDDESAVRVVVRSHHFLSGARISPDGRRLAWIGWDHPRMPWETTDLMVARLEGGVAVDPRRVLGGGEVSVPQAEWAGPDTLYAMADPDGWANLHRVDLAADGTHRSANVLPLEQECAGAVWRVDPSWFAVTASGVLLKHGVGDQRLALWDPATGALTDLAEQWTEFHGDLGADGDSAAVIAGAAALGTAVLRVQLPAPGSPSATVERCTAQAQDPSLPWQAVPERRTVRAPDGRDVHYVYYPPTHPGAEGPADEAPPLLIHAHGGPTNSNSATTSREFSYFCSRGFAVAAVDYGGSTGYGRAYRDRLRHTWGVTDVEDCVTVARALAAEGAADPLRTAIRGGSAGGWTTLAALAHTDVFCCGTVYYPISDALDWSGDSTHDFESRYLEYLIGTLPQDLPRYRRVSPLAHTDAIAVPLVMLQGADDFICKPDQAQRIIDAVSARGLWHRYLVFAGEGHGFRKADSVTRSVLAEVELYEHVMGITVDRGSRP